MAKKTNALPLKGKADAPARPRGSASQLPNGYSPDSASRGMSGTAGPITRSIASGGGTTINSTPTNKGR